MKIVDVKVYATRGKIDKPFVWRKGLPGSGDQWHKTILRIITDEGLEGVCSLGRGSGGILIDLMERRVKEMLIGQDPFMKEKIWEQMWEIDRIEEFPIYMMGFIDVALWDLTAKAAKLPLYKIIGGNSYKVPAYASTVTYENIDQYLRIADQILAKGYKAIKLHGWGDVKQDAKLAKALRKHVGDDIALMYDGSAGFDLQQSIWLGKHLEEADYLWFEEPMREFKINNYQRLCSELTIPILSAETSDGCHYNTADFIIQGAADIVRTGCTDKGGITGALRIAHLADSFGMKAEIHAGGLANLHLACAIPNNTYYEIIVHSEPAEYFEDIDEYGCVAPPDLPGTGEVFDWDLLESTAYMKL